MNCILCFIVLNFFSGPMPWPLVGNIPHVFAKQPGFDAYLDWEKQYGPVHTYYLGTVATVRSKSLDGSAKWAFP